MKTFVPFLAADQEEKFGMLCSYPPHLCITTADSKASVGGMVDQLEDGHRAGGGQVTEEKAGLQTRPFRRFVTSVFCRKE